MDKLLAMKMFVATVDAQGFSAAARRLGLATSSVTRLVDALETALGTTLLNRSTRQVSLTEAGARYYERARGIFEALDEADASVADRGEEPVGVLRLCLPVEFGRRVIAPHLGPFLARYPALELDIDLSDRLDDLLDGRYDLSIRLGDPSPNDELVCRQLGRFERWLVASPAYLAGREALQHPRQLLEHACLRFRYGQKARPWRLARGQDSLGWTYVGRYAAPMPTCCAKPRWRAVALRCWPTGWCARMCWPGACYGCSPTGRPALARPMTVSTPCTCPTTVVRGGLTLS